MSLFAAAQGQDAVLPYTISDSAVIVEFQREGLPMRVAIESALPASVTEKTEFLKNREALRAGAVALGSTWFKRGIVGSGDVALGMDSLRGMALGFDTDDSTISFWAKGGLTGDAANSWLRGRKSSAEASLPVRTVVLPLRFGVTGLPLLDIQIRGQKLVGAFSTDCYSGLYQTVYNDPRPTEEGFWFSNCAVGSATIPWAQFSELHPRIRPPWLGAGVGAVFSFFNLPSSRILIDFPSHRIFLTEIAPESLATRTLDTITGGPLLVQSQHIVFGGPLLVGNGSDELRGLEVTAITGQPSSLVLSNFLHPKPEGETWMNRFFKLNTKPHSINYIDAQGRPQSLNLDGQ